MAETDHIAGASPWEQAMYDHLTTHGKVEGEILDEYQQLVERDDISPAFRYLAKMILEDEVRHHRVFDDLAEALRQLAEVRNEDDPIPSLSGLRKDREFILSATERLLEVERDDAEELKDLAKQFKPFRETTLWPLLVEIMRQDTEKHITILEFIRARAEDAGD